MALAPLYCDACGSENRSQAAFCFNCGQVLQARSKTTTLRPVEALQANHLLKQRFRVLAKIGRGGFGAVYKAADLLFGNRLVAIKEMSQENLNPQELIEATNTFKQEALLLANLKHPHLPRIHDQFTEAGRWYLVMDYIEGETLEDYMLKLAGGKLSVDKVLSVAIQVCTVLEYLHNLNPPVIFRDLKPANIMLNPQGHIYLIDFGIARIFKPGQSRDTSALGSAGYAAPEQYGKAQTTPRADIYALGATMHELLTGINPADSPFHFAPLSLPTHPAHRELEQLIAYMVELDVHKRPQSATQVRQVLENVAAFKASVTTSHYQAISQVSGGYQLAQTPPQRRGTTQAQPMALPQPLSNTSFIGSKHTSRVTCVSWSARGTRVISSSYDKTVRVWDVHDGDNLLTYQGHWDRVLAAAWSPDGHLVASAGNDSTVQIWDPLTGNLALTYREHSQPVLSLAWSPDGKRIASSCEDKTVHIWDTITGEMLHIHRGHNARVLSLAWSPDGRSIASAGEDKLVHVWNMQRERGSFLTSWLFPTRSTFIFRGHFGRVNSLAWSPSGQRLASVGADKTLQVWDTMSGKKYFVHRNPSSTLTSVAWSYDGRYVATGGNDKLVHVWDTVTRNSITTYAGHTGYVTSVSWSPDGKQLVSASVDHTIHIWHL